jgi:hypothetical protein
LQYLLPARCASQNVAQYIQFLLHNFFLHKRLCLVQQFFYLGRTIFRKVYILI